jgi:hypothetical protein
MPNEAFFARVCAVYPGYMGTPSPGWDLLVRQTAEAARRRRRRRRQRRARWMLWLLTVVTTGAVVVIGLFVVEISRIPAVTRPTALTLHPGTTPAAHRVSPRAQPSVITYPQVTDVTSGLSYRLLAAPWRSGCPSDLITPMFNWSAGENTVAGQVTIGGSVIDWHAVACSGELQPQFSYAGPADLEPTAMSVLGAIDPAYYAGVPHTRTIEKNSAMRVSGHPAWIVEFNMNYPDGTSQGLTWSNELGAVVVADRGATQAPAVFYVSVPANLGTLNVAGLVLSLRLGGG